jgi:hypothetical protein
MSFKDMHCQCKLVLHWQLIRIVQCFISYQKGGIKWGDVAEKMIVIGWQCEIILHCKYISFNHKLCKYDWMIVLLKKNYNYVTSK